MNRSLEIFAASDLLIWLSRISADEKQAQDLTGLRTSLKKVRVKEDLNTDSTLTSAWGASGRDESRGAENRS